ncbi:contactin-1a isoform X2 [Gouania willdenowi]|uniref:Contactin-3 n=1 Tax=Gouania willdenowi TaxID=441366 RepID=A0A8C5DZ67_GOUWI|nr:contactin-1a-like isoform X2 [Gouania willdenowi]
MLHVFLLLPLVSTFTTESSSPEELPDFYNDESTGYGPVFEEQPVDTIYPEESPENNITINCRARAKPPATYRWMMEGADVNLSSSHYSLSGGNLIISNPVKSQHVGRYSCLASNSFGSVLSREASVQFGYLDLFSSEERATVFVKEGQGAVLLCAPPPHYPAELSFRWILDEFPIFIPLDKRRFVSQASGNLYISKVDSSDRGNYSCFASSTSISKSVFSNFIALEPISERPIRKYPADLKVKFPDTIALVGQNVTLECFALGNPVPEIRWKKLDGHLPVKHQLRLEGTQLLLSDVQPEDAGRYKCEAANFRWKDYHTARLIVEAFPEWEELITSTEKDLKSEYSMSCSARGDPAPSVSWRKNGEMIEGEELKFSSLTFDDSGIYQCIAENRHGVIHANAELRVFACAPTFDHAPLRRVLAARNRRVVIECRPKAAPKPKFSWSKGTELLSNSSRVSIWADGSLEILNVTSEDEGSYTCFAENDRGRANSSGSLHITDSTKITLAPSSADITVGQSTSMQCTASHDHSLDITFVWSLDGQVIDLHAHRLHYERPPNGTSVGELLIKNAQLKHGGLYTCMAQTAVDNVTASAMLVIRGPPGAPGGVRVTHKHDKNMTLQWSRGADNHSPISKYTIQYRDQFSQNVWRNASTAPAELEGNTETATVLDLSPWTEYEFRITATNTLGTGEPSKPSPKDRTLASVPVVAPSDVSGGGGAFRELTITWKPVQSQYFYGPGFGYIVAFKPREENQWKRVIVSDTQARRYIHKDADVPPLSDFHVKVKAFNSEGEGPYSLTAIIQSAPDVPTEAPVLIEGRALSASVVVLSWSPLVHSVVDGYQIKFWRTPEDSEGGAQRAVVSGRENHTKLEGLKHTSRYVFEVRGYNTAGYGPASRRLHIHTKKPPPSRPPVIVSKKLKGAIVNIVWKDVEPMDNESAIDGYRVLYRPRDQSTGLLYMTQKSSINVPQPTNGSYVVEVRAHTEGGDGAMAQIDLTGGSVSAAAPSLDVWLLALRLLALLYLTL